MAITYSISDLAREFDLTTRAIRFYEDMGLLQPQRTGTGGRSRTYSARDRTRLKLTLRAKRLGLSLTEAKEIIDSYDSPRDTAPQLRKFLQVLANHRRKLETQLLDLQANLAEIRTHEKEARVLLAHADTAGQTALTTSTASRRKTSATRASTPSTGQPQPPRPKASLPATLTTPLAKALYD